jgi:stage II sporulation protein R
LPIFVYLLESTTSLRFLFKNNSLRFSYPDHNEDSEGMVRVMRNKYIVWAYLVILSIGTILSLYIPKNEVTAQESAVIPNEAIRLRILANSDYESDQSLKRLVRDKVNENITEWVSDLTSIEEARTLIKSKLPEVQRIARDVLAEQHSEQTVKVDFGKVKFPTKLYGEFLYPAGEYEAILITLGEGKGANWWCVLYPPLCFLDFSSGVAVSDGFDEQKKQRTQANAEEHAASEKVKEPATSEAESGQKDLEDPAEPKVRNGKTDSEEPVREDVQSGKTHTDEPAKKYAQSEKSRQGNQHKTEPVYVENDEQPVEVKFFVKEIWDKLID